MGALRGKKTRKAQARSGEMADGRRDGESASMKRRKAGMGSGVGIRSCSADRDVSDWRRWWAGTGLCGYVIRQGRVHAAGRPGEAGRRRRTGARRMCRAERVLYRRRQGLKDAGPEGTEEGAGGKLDCQRCRGLQTQSAAVTLAPSFRDRVRESASWPRVREHLHSVPRSCGTTLRKAHFARPDGARLPCRSQASTSPEVRPPQRLS